VFFKTAGGRPQWPAAVHRSDFLAQKLNKKLFGTLFFALFATITGVGIVVPLLPVYANNLGASGFYIGLIFGAFSLSRSAFLPWFGRWSDLKGRKPFIVTGLLAYAGVSVAFILSTQVGHLIIIRFFQGIASAMIMPVVQAYIGDITPPGQEGFTMGMFNMSMFFGLSLGPVAGGLIKDHFSLNTTFMAMGFLALVGFGLCLGLLPDKSREFAMRHEKKPRRWRDIVGDRVIMGLFCFRLAYTGSIGIIWGFLPVLADEQLGLSSSQIGILVMLGVLISGAIQAPMGYVADRWRRKPMVIMGGLLAGAAVFAYSRADSFMELFMISTVFGLGGGIAMPAIMAVSVNKGQQAEAMGSVISLLTMAHSLGMMFGALLAGLMMDWFQLRGAFELGAAWMFVGVVGFILLAGNAQVDNQKKD
jgi:MFS family permease